MASVLENMFQCLVELDNFLEISWVIRSRLSPLAVFLQALGIPALRHINLHMIRKEQRKKT